MRQQLKLNLRLFFLGLVPLLALGLVWYLGANYGMSLEPDSAEYINVAQNLIAGHGFVSAIVPWNNPTPFVEISKFPPGYTLALVPFMTAGLSPFQAAWVLSGLMYLLTLFAVGWAVYAGLRSFLLALLAQIAVFTAPALLALHLMAMSEVLFVPALTLSLTFLCLYVRDRRTWYLIGAGICAGIAALTRWIGAAVLLTGVLSLALFSQQSPRGRVRDLLLFAAFAVAPWLLWLVRNQIVTGHLMGVRNNTAYSIQDVLGFYGHVLINWTPDQTAGFAPYLVLLLIGLLFLLFAWVMDWLKQPPQLTQAQSALLGIHAVFCVSYFLLLVWAHLASDPSLLDRYIFPVLPAFIISVIAFNQIAWTVLQKARPRARGLAGVGSASLALIILISIPNFIKQIETYQTNGPQELGAPSLKDDSAIRWLQDFRANPALALGSCSTAGSTQGTSAQEGPATCTDLALSSAQLAHLPIYSNSPEAISLFTGLRARYAPFVNENLKPFVTQVCSKPGLVVFFDWFQYRNYLISEKNLQDNCQPQTVLHFEHGSVYIVGGVGALQSEIQYSDISNATWTKQPHTGVAPFETLVAHLAVPPGTKHRVEILFYAQIGLDFEVDVNQRYLSQVMPRADGTGWVTYSATLPANIGDAVDIKIRNLDSMQTLPVSRIRVIGENQTP